nr:tetratricopeptide repeat protein [Luteimonas saliphila]
MRDGVAQPVEPKAFAVLLALLRRPGELVARDDLLDQVWGHRHVTPGVLTRAIAQLRAALDDDPQHPRYIQTRHALGYRFVGALLDARDHAKPPDPAAGPTMAASMQDAVPLIAPAPSPPSDVAEHAHDARSQRPPAWRLRHWVIASTLVAAIVSMTWWQTRQAVPRAAEASVAVLPFANLGGIGDDDYFAQGLALEMHDALASVPGLKVAAQLSPEAVSIRDQDPKSVGRRLGVATLLDASVRREGGRMRINARLTDTATGFTLWSRRYDREPEDVFAIQSEIADEVVRSLVGVISGQREALEKRLAPTRSVMAFDAYLHGLQSFLHGLDAGDAVRYFDQALAQDANFARAQAGICRAEVAMFLDRNDAEAYDRADAACARALEMDPLLGEAMVAQAELHLARGEHAEAIEYYSKAEADPARRVAVYVGLANTHAQMGRREKAREYFDRALSLRPDDPRIHSQIGYRNYLDGDFPAAIASYRKAVELQPDNAPMWSYLGAIYLVSGRADEASRALSRSIEISPTYSALTNLGEIRYFEGDYVAAARLHRDALKLDASDYLVWGNLGQALLALPDARVQAREAFRQAERLSSRYLELKPEDAKALAALGWYRVNLGRAVEEVHELVRRSTELGSEPSEVALFNAQTLVALGELVAARAQVENALAAGMAGYRIHGNPALSGIDGVPPRTDAAEGDTVRSPP